MRIRGQHSIWEDRLAEVWASPGRSGSGVVVGTFGILTARHVIAGPMEAASGGRVLARVIRRRSPAAWVPMRIVGSNSEWDLAILEVDQSRLNAAAWLKPSSPSPIVVKMGSTSEEGCEAVGFPDDAVQHGDDTNPIDAVRQSEQLRGTLLPIGQAKPPVAPGRALPPAWMPLDVDTVPPAELSGWGGMSGAGVVLPDGRIAGLVVAAEHGKAQRRLYVVPVAAALANVPDLATSLAAVVGKPVVAEALSAPFYRRALYNKTLGADGLPQRLGEVVSLGVFGVKPLNLPGEPSYLEYVPRDDDETLRKSLTEAAYSKRAFLLVGDAGSGKSRSAAEASRSTFTDHRLVRPLEHQLAQLCELPLADLGPALVWLDDAEKYALPALREILERLLETGAVVVGTIRRKELQALTEAGEIRNPAGESLADTQLILRLDWRREWSPSERSRAPQHITNSLARQAVADGMSIGVWAVAGPQLVNQFTFARSDEDHPSRFAIVRAVLDWYRTGLTTPPPPQVAAKLINEAYLNRPANDDELTDAIRWSTHPIDVGGRKARYSLLTLRDDGLAINDYIQDYDRRHDPPAIPDQTWSAAGDYATDPNLMCSVATTAYHSGHFATAEALWERAAGSGDARAMYNLGLMFVDQHPSTARTWWDRAAAIGHTTAMANLGALLAADDPATARALLERAAARGNTDAMYNLGVILAREDPVRARGWLEQAAAAGDAGAMDILGRRVHRR